MADYVVSTVSKTDVRTLKKLDQLLVLEGIKRDKNLEHICVIYDSEYNVIATGSAFGNTLRCFAVSSKHQGEGLLNLVLSHLLEWEFAKGNQHVFLYTKPTAAKFFKDLGFYEIARVEGSLVFMENVKGGFSSYLASLRPLRFEEGVSGCIVMNANPFTKGHRYLVEQACKSCNHLHLFVVSEDLSLVPYLVRLRLIKEGTSDLDKVLIHESGSYIISNATFPSYFLKDDEDVMHVHATLDAQLFTLIAQALNITVRFVGTEPTSVVTNIYNQVLGSLLPKAGLQLEVISRLEIDGKPVSASSARKAICSGDFDLLKTLVPETTYEYFISDEAKPVISKIRSATDVAHF